MWKLLIAVVLVVIAGSTPEEKEKPLKVGDPAPALRASKWLQGEEVKNFQPGKVYVVEFWATWCGLCIHFMPHAAGLIGGAGATASARTKEELAADDTDPVSRGKPLSEWIKDLKDKNYSARQTAAEAIGALGPKAKAAVPALREAMVIEDHMVQGPPAKALWQVDRAAFTDILKSKARSDRERFTAILALTWIGPDAKELTPVVLTIAQDRKDSGNREHALLALGFIGADPKVVVPVLLEALHDKLGQYGRYLSAQALGELGPQAKEALPDLHAALKDPDAQVRVDAAGAIWKIEKQSAGLVPVLMDALTGGNAAARQRATHYLGQIGPEAKVAFPALFKLWQEERNDFLRGEYAAALKAIDASAAAKGSRLSPSHNHHRDPRGCPLDARSAGNTESGCPQGQIRNRR